MPSTKYSRGPLTPYQASLVEGFAARYANPAALVRRTNPALYDRATRAGLDDHDIESATWEAVERAARRYSPAGGAGFATYAMRHVRWVVANRTHYSPRSRAGRAGRRVESLARSGYGDRDADSNPADPTDPARDPEEFDRLAAIRRHLAAQLAGLPPRWRAVLELRYGLGGGEPLLSKEVARRLGVSRQRVHQIEWRAIRQIHDHLWLHCRGLVGGRR